MKKERFHIISDSSCDLPDEYLADNDITLVPFYVSFGKDEYLKERVDIGVREFYQKMVDNPNVFPKSSTPSIADFYDAMEPYVKEGVPVLCICITMKFSASYQSALNAREMLLEEYPDAVIAVMDSRVDTVLQGLFVIEAVKLRDQGIDVEEAESRLSDIRDTGRIFFTVGTFAYLQINGRIGKVAKSMTSILSIRPVITLRDGEIFPSGIARSRKQTIKKVISLIEKYVDEVRATARTYAINIGYGFDKSEAESFRDEVILALAPHGMSLGPDDIRLYQIGAAIGVHTGPNPLGVTIIKRA